MAKGIANRNTAKYNFEEQHICFIDSETVSFAWDKSNVERFLVMWDEGISVEGIAKKFNRNPIDVMILLLEMGEEERLERRPTGLFGVMV
jgi:hypothetical protein